MEAISCAFQFNVTAKCIPVIVSASDFPLKFICSQPVVGSERERLNSMKHLMIKCDNEPCPLSYETKTIANRRTYRIKISHAHTHTNTLSHTFTCKLKMTIKFSV